MTSLPPLHLSATDKLRVLRRLDRFRTWSSLDDQRQCIQCGEVFSGRDIDVVGGTRELGPLRLQCPTENCPAIPMDWIMPTDSSLEARKTPRPDPGHAGEKLGPLRRFFRTIAPRRRG